MSKLLRVRSIASWLAAALLVATAPPTGQAAQRQTREHHVFVTVLDTNDAPVSNLTPESLLVREDGISREILKVAPAAPPSHLVLLVDDSQITDGLQVDLRMGLKAFVTGLGPGSPGPLTRLATFGDRPTTRVEYTTTPSALVAAIDNVFPKAGAGSTFLQALVETCRDLRTRAATRPVIVAFVAEEGVEFSDDTHERIADALQAAGASLWTVVLEDRRGQNRSDPNRERSIVLGDVLRQSGGYNKTVLSKQGIEPGFKVIATAINNQLDVIYARAESLVPPKKLEVTLRRGSGRVLAPQWIRP